MPHPTKLAALLLLALAAPLAAQEATEDTPQAADPAEGLDMGTPVAEGEPAVGEAYTRETFGDWSLRCLNAAEGFADVGCAQQGVGSHRCGLTSG